MRIEKKAGGQVSDLEVEQKFKEKRVKRMEPLDYKIKELILGKEDMTARIGSHILSVWSCY